MVSASALRKAAENVVNNSFSLRRGERMLLIGNPGTRRITSALVAAAERVGATVDLVEQGRKSPLQPAEPQVRQAFQNAIENPYDVVYTALEHKLGFDPEARAKPLVHKGVPYNRRMDYLRDRFPNKRIYWSPSLSEQIFANLAGVDFAGLYARASKLKKLLAKAKAVEVVTVDSRGREHKLVVNVNERKFPALLCTGYSGKGVKRPQGNLPSGEWFTTPVSANGRVVINGSMSHLDGSNVVRNPFVVHVKDGFVTQVEGKGSDAKKLIESLARSAAKAKKDFKGRKGEQLAQWTYQLGEFALGLNEKIVQPIGVMLSDEKIFRTGHIAVGATFHGERQQTPTHFDLIFVKPTVTALIGKGEKTRRVTLLEKGEMKF